MSVRAWTAALLAGAALGGCATEGPVDASFYGGVVYYDDLWYGGAWAGACCVDLPDEVGPPHPEHPIALPPGSSGARPANPIANPGDAARPSQPIASQPKASTSQSSRSMPAPRAAAGGGMRGGGGGRGGGGRR
jgi:uncharacterized membrane protein YgcG